MTGSKAVPNRAFQKRTLQRGPTKHQQYKWPQDAGVASPDAGDTQRHPLHPLLLIQPSPHPIREVLSLCPTDSGREAQTGQVIIRSHGFKWGPARTQSHICSVLRMPGQPLPHACLCSQPLIGPVGSPCAPGATGKGEPGTA